MGLFDWLTSRSKEEVTTPEPVAKQAKQPASPPAPKEEPVSFDDLAWEPGEYEEVAAIAAACLTESRPQADFHIRRIEKLDPDIDAVAAIAAAVLAHDQADSQFHIKTVTRIK
ncbi:hypothetical protein AWM75_07075 [Aerococcus urinaehominis]|uniref:Uncharacterized protein n=1 Tax=Aerococcus urinaehominis TaxID=128944 RepID=A0A0X8FMD3_9LACT|nr:hypothetical protein [Aerococcus urinaehominis]AMB99739.1 hypothetical protein AWM75_07075 [Aerococcus urinaehominis]SDM10829.1 hypothetical protein SAMN04487985_10574 [Aerococcus urinaehominis]